MDARDRSYFAGLSRYRDWNASKQDELIISWYRSVVVVVVVVRGNTMQSPLPTLFPINDNDDTHRESVTNLPHLEPIREIEIR